MLKAFYQISTYKKNGKLQKKYPKKLSRSFVKQFLQIMYACTGSGGDTILDTDGVSRSISSGGSFNMYQSRAGDSAYSYGIRIGTGTNAISTIDYSLQTPVTEDYGGSIEELGSWSSNLQTSSSTSSFDIEKLYYYTGVGSLTINEIGVYVNAYYCFCSIRDLVVPSVTVNTNEYLKVKYTIEIAT